jgi:hypothetical protein
MKKFHQYTMILLAGVLGACSSMSVNDPYEDSLPAGFNASVYVELHPQLRVAEIKDYVAYRNELVSDSLKKAGVDDATLSAFTANDETAFLANTAVAQGVYTVLAGHSAAEWEAYIAQKGSTEKEAKQAVAKVEKELKEFNFINVIEDLNAWSNVPKDQNAYSMQYTLYGKSHGWAYRYCSDSENITNLPVPEGDLDKGIPAAKNPTDFTPITYLVCYDKVAMINRVIQ